MCVFCVCVCACVLYIKYALLGSEDILADCHNLNHLEGLFEGQDMVLRSTLSLGLGLG